MEEQGVVALSWRSGCLAKRWDLPWASTRYTVALRKTGALIHRIRKCFSLAITFPHCGINSFYNFYFLDWYLMLSLLCTSLVWEGRGKSCSFSVEFWLASIFSLFFQQEHPGIISCVTLWVGELVYEWACDQDQAVAYSNFVFKPWKTEQFIWKKNHLLP